VASVEVCDDSYKDNSVLQALPFEHPQRNVLHEGVDTDYDVWLVLLQSSLHLPSSIDRKPFRTNKHKQQYMWFRKLLNHGI
jgi:hypothetical protein